MNKLQTQLDLGDTVTDEFQRLSHLLSVLLLESQLCLSSWRRRHERLRPMKSGGITSHDQLCLFSNLNNLPISVIHPLLYCTWIWISGCELFVFRIVKY